MKYSVLTTLLIFATVISSNAQQRQKNHVILKTDVASFFLHRIGLGVEAQIDQRNSLVFNTGWQKMNRDLPILHTGTYELDYQVIHTESSGLLSGAESSTTITPKPVLEKSTFLATSVIPFQASFRTYLGKNDQKVRFFIQPGIRILHFKGLHANVDQTLVSRETDTYDGSGWWFLDLLFPNSTTTTETYHQTTTVTSTSGKTVGGGSLDFGLHYQSKGRFSCDAGMQLGFNDAAGVYGLQKNYFTPMMSLGVRI